MFHPVPHEHAPVPTTNVQLAVCLVIFDELVRRPDADAENVAAQDARETARDDRRRARAQRQATASSRSAADDRAIQPGLTARAESGRLLLPSNRGRPPRELDRFLWRALSLQPLVTRTEK